MTDTIKKEKKPKGPIRYEAIIPVLVISIITFAYFSFFFDRHMKKLIEYVGTQANGAEVNVDSINTSFIHGSFDLNRLQVTAKDQPTHNILEIGNVHFQYLWDALLRMKFVVDDASINNIQMYKPRTSPGKVLPPEPVKPSKLHALENQVLDQVKNKYGGNMLGDALSVLQGGDYKDQIEKIRETLKSETRVKEMIADVQTKREFWDGKVKTLGDTSKLKEIETKVNAISKGGGNIMEQAKGVKELSDLLNQVNKQFKEVEGASKQLQAEVNAVTQYPKELQTLVNEDVNSLKDHFKIPKLDFKDMAMHLFAGQFAEYLAKARKYHALAKQYMPEKKKEKDKDEVLPPKRADGSIVQFPITSGYPLFWLKRAALSSKGTADSYSGNVSGELTNVTSDPKYIRLPIKLDMNGDFPAAKVMGVKALFTLDHTHEIAKQSALLQVNHFEVPEKLFVNDGKMKFGFLNAIGTSTISATIQQDQVNMTWTSALNQPHFVVETSSPIAKEILTNVMNNIPVININGSASGPFTNLNMSISSNLGDELGAGLKREIGLKVTEAQNKLTAMVDEKINQPREKLMAEISGNNKNLSSMAGIQELYKKNQAKIEAEIDKLKKGGSKKTVDDLKEQGKKLFKGIKF